MAINNGRTNPNAIYDVNGNYLGSRDIVQPVAPVNTNPNAIYDVNGNYLGSRDIVQPVASTKTKYTLPNQQMPTQQSSGVRFTPQDVYALQSKGYANQGNNVLSSLYGGMANGLGKYSKFANTSVNAADALLNYMRNNEQGLQSTAGGLYNNLVNDLQNQRDYVYNTFGPEGTLTNEVNKYYNDLGNYLSTEAGRQNANIAAKGIHTGASAGAIRAQQNEAYNDAFNRYVQAKEQQINAKQNIAANLVNFMSTLRQEYGDTTNTYVIDLYKRANDLYNQVAQSAANDLNQYNMLLATPQTSGSGTSASGTDILTQLSNLATILGLGDTITNPDTNKEQNQDKKEGTNTPIVTSQE